MPVQDADIVNVDLPPLGAGESFFLPEVFKGLGTTMRHILGSVGGSSRPNNRAMEYPEQRREDLPVEEGGHRNYLPIAH
ncbi:MAG: hypothetical protein AAGH92_08400 [Planctomycetota bacterium]